jgi:hypothetical protein
MEKRQRAPIAIEALRRWGLNAELNDFLSNDAVGAQQHYLKCNRRWPSPRVVSGCDVDLHRHPTRPIHCVFHCIERETVNAVNIASTQLSDDVSSVISAVCSCCGNFSAPPRHEPQRLTNTNTSSN